MKVCDRCKAAAVDTVIIDSDDQRFDVCLSCKNSLMEFIAGEMPEEPAETKKGKNERRTPAASGTA